MLRLIFTIVILNFFLCSFSQETIINLSFSQAKELELSAGPDIFVPDNEMVNLGLGIQFSGGSPEFQFEWKLPSGEILYEQFLNVSEPGKYVLTILDSKNCSASDSVLLIPTFLNPNRLNAKIKVYPNPAGEFVILEFEPGLNFKSIEILDSNGNTIKILPLPDHKKLKKIEYSLWDILPGIYFFVIKTDRIEEVHPLIKY